jgi:hypothetical protein
MQDEAAANLVKRSLYVIEDNLKPGNKDYDNDRETLNQLIIRNKEYIEKDKNDELK